jgi:hypothetical protein
MILVFLYKANFFYEGVDNFTFIDVLVLYNFKSRSQICFLYVIFKWDKRIFHIFVQETQTFKITAFLTRLS